MTDRERLLKLIESKRMTAKQFSDEVGIGTGTLSNITGGRNKPSLEVMQRVLTRFTDVNPQWLILGTGKMYLTDGPESIDTNGVENSAPDLFSDLQIEDLPTPTTKSATTQPAETSSLQKKITRIIIYYSDGTYEER